MPEVENEGKKRRERKASACFESSQPACLSLSSPPHPALFDLIEVIPDILFGTFSASFADIQEKLKGKHGKTWERLVVFWSLFERTSKDEKGSERPGQLGFINGTLGNDTKKNIDTLSMAFVRAIQTQVTEHLRLPSEVTEALEDLQDQLREKMSLGPNRARNRLLGLAARSVANAKLKETLGLRNRRGVHRPLYNYSMYLKGVFEERATVDGAIYTAEITPECFAGILEAAGELSMDIALFFAEAVLEEMGSTQFQPCINHAVINNRTSLLPERNAKSPEAAIRCVKETIEKLIGPGAEPDDTAPDALLKSAALRHFRTGIITASHAEASTANMRKNIQDFISNLLRTHLAAKDGAITLDKRELLDLATTVDCVASGSFAFSMEKRAMQQAPALVAFRSPAMPSGTRRPKFGRLEKRRGLGQSPANAPPAKKGKDSNNARRKREGGVAAAAAPSPASATSGPATHAAAKLVGSVASAAVVRKRRGRPPIRSVYKEESGDSTCDEDGNAVAGEDDESDAHAPDTGESDANASGTSDGERAHVAPGADKSDANASDSDGSASSVHAARGKGRVSSRFGASAAGVEESGGGVHATGDGGEGGSAADAAPQALFAKERATTPAENHKGCALPPSKERRTGRLEPGPPDRAAGPLSSSAVFLRPVQATHAFWALKCQEHFALLQAELESAPSVGAPLESMWKLVTDSLADTIASACGPAQRPLQPRMWRRLEILKVGRPRPPAVYDATLRFVRISISNAVKVFGAAPDAENNDEDEAVKPLLLSTLNYIFHKSILFAYYYQQRDGEIDAMTTALHMGEVSEDSLPILFLDLYFEHVEQPPLAAASTEGMQLPLATAGSDRLTAAFKLLEKLPQSLRGDCNVAQRAQARVRQGRRLLPPCRSRGHQPRSDGSTT